MRQPRHDSSRSDDSIRAAIYTRISFDDTDREEGVERQVAANRDRARNGRLFTDSRPLGLKHELFLDDDGELRMARVVPEEAEVVRAVYRAFLEGNSLDVIARASRSTTSRRCPTCRPTPGRHI